MKINKVDIVNLDYLKDFFDFVKSKGERNFDMGFCKILHQVRISFEIEELLARINALFRRVNYSTPQTPASSVKDLTLNLDRMSFTIKDAEVQLSKTEFLLLKLLIENQSKVFSRQQIIDEIWGKNHFIDENTVDVYVGYLRSKISEHTKDEYIRTVRGAGYTME